MRIAMIGHKDFPSRSGGVEVVVYELATRLADKGHEVVVYNRLREEKEQDYASSNVTAKYVFAPVKGGFNALLGSFSATLCALFGKYDIIHYHAIGPALPIFIPHLFGKRTVVTVHGLDWQRAKWGRFASAYLKLGERMAARFADEVIVLSEDTQKYFMDTYGRETTLIKNAIVPIDVAPCNIIKEKFGLSKDGYILYLSRITPEKGLCYLISAYKQSGVKKKLVIGGAVPDDEYGTMIKSMASECDDIIFTGFADLKTVRELYSNCALYVLPSEIEGLALTLLEAMSSGANCLTSDIPENTAVIRDYGTVFKSKDEASLESALKTALEKPRSADDIAKQREYIKEHYSYDAVVGAHEAVYLKVSK